MPIDCYQLLDDPPPAESMGFVALKNVERPMELMRIWVERPEEPDAESTQPTADDDDVPAEAVANDATMKA
jgi:hypothetical protein